MTTKAKARKSAPDGATATTVSRSTTFDLYAPDAEVRDAVRNSIKVYRGCCRQLYAALLIGQTAGMKLDDENESVRFLPDGDRGKIAMAAAIGAAKIVKGAKVKGHGQQYAVNVGPALGYELRNWFRTELYPTSKSFVWDSARDDVMTTWTSRDPEFPQARRGYLALQGARNVARFNYRGIGMPVASARPKLAGRTLTLSWDHVIGSVTFGLADKIDGGRWHVWRALRDGDEGWSLGTIYLTEREGKLKAVVTYHRPADLREVDASRVLRVKFHDSQSSFLVAQGPDGVATHLGLDAFAAVGCLDRLKVQRDKWEDRKKSSGNPRRPWGHRSQYKSDQAHLSRVTLQRTRVTADFSHAWSRRLADRAATWRCGTVVIGPRPDKLFGHDWPWSQLLDFVRYKCKNHGIVVEVEEPEPKPKEGKQTNGQEEKQAETQS